MPQKIIIIGGVGAGMSAAAKARRVAPDSEIVVYTEEAYISYAGCGLPYFIGGKVQNKDRLIARTIPEFAQQNISVKILSRVEEIRPERKAVKIWDLTQNLSYEDFYDRLIITTGARPFIPPVEGADLTGVFSLRTIDHSLRIKEYLLQNRPKNVVIFGGGYIGLEMTETFLELGCEVSILVRSSHIISNMDEDMTQIIQEYLTSKGVTIYTGQSVLGFTGNQTVQAVATSQGNISADLVLLSTGVVPNSELAASIGIDLGVKKAIRINERAETNLPDIYSAGDCATTVHLITGKESYIPMGTTANKQGRVAGENAAGGNAFLKGVLGTGIARAMEMEVSRTGLSEKECKDLGLDYTVKMIKSKTAAHYCPVSKPIYLKLMVDNATRRLVGAQIVGFAGAAMRIDMLATAITMGATVDHLLDMDLAYSPPFSPVWDPVLIALNQF